MQYMLLIHGEEAAVFILREWQLAQLLPLPAGRLFHAIIESINGHGVIRIMQRSAKFRQGLDWIINGTAMQAGMQIRTRAGEANLEANNAAQARRDDNLVS